MKAIFCECSLPFWVDVATKLAHERGWEICYWTAGPSVNEQEIRRRFPGIVFHDNYDAVRGIPPSECRDLKPAAVDQELLRDLAYHESIVLKMMDRMDPGLTFAYHERIRMYHRYLGYWLAVLNHFKVDVVVSPSSPHLMYDYVLYALCLKMDVKTPMFVDTVWPDLMLPLRRFEKGPEDILAEYQKRVSQGESEHIELSSRMEEYRSRMGTGTYAEIQPFYMQAHYEKAQQRIDSVLRFPNLLKVFNIPRYPLYFRKLFLPQSLPIPRSYLKQKGKRVEESYMSHSEFVSYRGDARRKKEQLSAYYEKMATDIEVGQPFVFVALGFQPERSTVPDGGQFGYQLLMVDMLSKTVPSGWSVYVKEHPLQFASHLSGELSREFDFYDDMVSLPNVKLIHSSVTSYDLITQARCVAAVTGTAAWEAVMRGKPALIFGYPWYFGCEGTFYVPTHESCRNALSKIEKGYQVNEERMRLYLYLLEQMGCHGWAEPSATDLSGISDEQNVLAIMQAIEKLTDG